MLLQLVIQLTFSIDVMNKEEANKLITFIPTHWQLSAQQVDNIDEILYKLLYMRQLHRTIVHNPST